MYKAGKGARHLQKYFLLLHQSTETIKKELAVTNVNIGKLYYQATNIGSP